MAEAIMGKAKPKLDASLIRKRFALSQERMSTLLRVSVKTVMRWEKKQGKPQKQEQIMSLAKLNEIWELGRKIYTKEGLKEFLRTPLPIFDGKTAFDLILIGEYDRVIGALAAELEGIGF
jgi:transcriptional regulator with XRE-family HTH domain